MQHMTRVERPQRAGNTHFLTRRLKNVRSEMALNVLAYNIKLMVALLDVRGLMRAMQV